jgi:hypothetical protein
MPPVYRLVSDFSNGLSQFTEFFEQLNDPLAATFGVIALGVSC